MEFIVDPLDYRLSLRVHGLEEGFDFNVDRQVGERLQGVLSAEYEDMSILPFFYFQTTDGQQVIVCMTDIEVVNYLFETGISLSPQSCVEAEEDLLEVLLFFRNRAEPWRCNSEDIEQLNRMIEDLATEPFSAYKFLSFIDEDGEMVTFNAQHLVLCIIKAIDWSAEGGESF
jgi:hypothetical protein